MTGSQWKNPNKARTNQERAAKGRIMPISLHPVPPSSIYAKISKTFLLKQEAKKIISMILNHYSVPSLICSYLEELFVNIMKGFQDSGDILNKMHKNY